MREQWAVIGTSRSLSTSHRNLHDQSVGFASFLSILFHSCPHASRSTGCPLGTQWSRLFHVCRKEFSKPATARRARTWHDVIGFELAYRYCVLRTLLLFSNRTLFSTKRRIKKIILRVLVSPRAIKTSTQAPFDLFHIYTVAYI
jgi:hypothetical protein